eukprot:TRINITY_DN175_c0_g1_i13.p1 TRINITY_DN175_c0_g1~~TRINITY_DN175_c0_g1_i13.p1  ORF type:complete len:1930 (+),score=452.56 TRINITY_DN175_c0_g1_i13:183-5972(+)
MGAGGANGEVSEAGASAEGDGEGMAFSSGAGGAGEVDGRGRRQRQQQQQHDRTASHLVESRIRGGRVGEGASGRQERDGEGTQGAGSHPAGDLRAKRRGLEGTADQAGPPGLRGGQRRREGEAGWCGGLVRRGPQEEAREAATTMAEDVGRGGGAGDRRTYGHPHKQREGSRFGARREPGQRRRQTQSTGGRLAGGNRGRTKVRPPQCATRDHGRAGAGLATEQRVEGRDGHSRHPEEGAATGGGPVGRAAPVRRGAGGGAPDGADGGVEAATTANGGGERGNEEGPQRKLRHTILQARVPLFLRQEQGRGVLGGRRPREAAGTGAEGRDRGHDHRTEEEEDKEAAEARTTTTTTTATEGHHDQRNRARAIQNARHEVAERSRPPQRCAKEGGTQGDGEQGRDDPSSHDKRCIPEAAEERHSGTEHGDADGEEEACDGGGGRCSVPEKDKHEHEHEQGSVTEATEEPDSLTLPVAEEARPQQPRPQEANNLVGREAARQGEEEAEGACPCLVCDLPSLTGSMRVMSWPAERQEGEGVRHGELQAGTMRELHWKPPQLKTGRRKPGSEEEEDFARLTAQGIHPNPGPNMYVSTVNVASLRNQIEEVTTKLDVDVICTQETALTLAGQQEMERELGKKTKKKWKPMWGPPQPGRKVEGIASNWVAQRGGLATLIREPRTALPGSLDTNDQSEEQRRRWLHTQVAIDGKRRWLHIISIYCPAGTGREETAKRETLLHYILRKKAKELGNVPILVVGDFNTDEARSPELRKALQAGWADTADLCAKWRGKQPDPTFVRENCATRIDRILASPEAVPAITGKAFETLSRCTEDLLIDQPVGTPGRAAYVGRGKHTSTKEKEVCAPTTTGTVGAATTWQARLEKLKLKTRTLQQQLEQAVEDKGLSKPTLNTIRNVNREAKALAVPAEPVPHDAVLIEDMLAAALNMEDAIAAEERKKRTEANTSRRREYLAEVAAGRETTRLVKVAKGKRQSDGTRAVKEGMVLFASPGLIDSVMRKAWKTVFAKYESRPEPLYAPFKAKYSKFVQRHEMERTQLTGARLREVLRKKSKKSAAGIDGWRMLELRKLPESVLDAWAMLFHAIEATGRWPEAMKTALVTLVPKCDDAGPLEHRPITVTSAVYRLWACARLSDILIWQEKWIHDKQYGFRTGFGTEDALLDLALDIEESILEGKPLVGVALDFAKCFDSVPQQLVLELVEDMGMETGILRALKGMYAGMRRRFRYATGVGEEFHTTNGILQGCPISVVLINALLAVLMKQVEDGTGVRSLSYADDAYLLAQLAAALQKGVEAVEDFCKMVGMKLNVKKTKTFTTGAKAPEVKVDGEVLQAVRTVEVLGAKLRTDGQQQYNNDRAKEAMKTLSRLGATPLSFQQKARIISSTLLPSCLYDAPFSPPRTGMMELLVMETTYTLWGQRYRTRSPGAVLSVTLPGHTHHPKMTAAYKALMLMYRACRKDDQLWARCNDIAKLYREGKKALGLVGNLKQRWLPMVQATWDQLKDTMAMEKERFRHYIRDKLRRGEAEAIMGKRSSMKGMATAAAVETNELWGKLASSDPIAARNLRRVITGAVFYIHPRGWRTDAVAHIPPTEEEVDEEDSRDDSEDEEEREAGGEGEVAELERMLLAEQRQQDEPATARCDVCGQMQQVSNILEHALWECELAVEVGQREAHAGTTRTGLEPCMRLHGILPREAAKEDKDRLEKTQRYLLAVVGERDAALQAKRQQIYRTHQWLEITEGEAHPAPTEEEFARLQTGNTLKEYTKPVLKWLKQLRWYGGNRSTAVSTVELALDFENVTQKSLGGKLGELAEVRQKARRLHTVMKKVWNTWELGRLQKKVKGRRAFPAEPCKRVHTLRSIGGTKAVIGWSRRAIFASTKTKYDLEELGKQWAKERREKVAKLGRRPARPPKKEKPLLKGDRCR